MLRKFTLGLLALTISSHSFALEIYKGTILNHKESTTSGIQGVLKQKTTHITSLRTLEDEKHEDDIVNVDSLVRQQSAILGQPTKIEGNQSVLIVNTSGIAQKYNINTSICVDSSTYDKNTGQCYYIYDTISLEAGGYYNEDYTPELLMTFNDLSPRNLTASVEISKPKPSSGNFNLFDYIGGTHSETNIIITAQQ